MASITVHNLPDEVHRALRARAARHGRSTEAEVRGRILPFNLPATRAYAELMTRARNAGRTLGTADGYIAATAAANGLVVASRDTSPYQAAGVRVVDPRDAPT